MSSQDIATTLQQVQIILEIKQALPWNGKLLTWTEQDGVIKAVPKRKLSDKNHKSTLREFKRRGGAYVSHNGEAYFELVTKPRNSHSTAFAVSCRRATEKEDWKDGKSKSV